MKKYAVLGVMVVATMGLVGSSWACGGGKCAGGAQKVGCAGKANAACCGSADRACRGAKGASGLTKTPGGVKEDHGYGAIDTLGLKSLLNSGARLTLVDARGGKYDDGTRIPGALNIPAGSSKSDIASALPDKDALIVAYCSNLKCPASAMLADQLVKLGYKNVVKYPAGIAEWIRSGNEVTGKSDD